MRLNTIKQKAGSKQAPRRVGRGGGSGLGKTCGLGHKGQRARAGGYHKLGFEGGQMPLQRRVPKFGFNSLHALNYAEIRLHQLNKIADQRIDLRALRKADLINHHITTVKIISRGKIEKPVTVVGLEVTAGAKKAIETAGGKIEANG